MLTKTELKAVGRKFFAEISEEYGIHDAAGLALLEEAASCLDRLHAAHAAIAKDGEIVTDRYGRPRLHPALTLEKESRRGLLDCLRALNLDIEPLNRRTG